MAAPTLFCYFARIGDLVMLTPVLRALAAQGTLELCARPWARGLLSRELWLAAVHTLDKPNRAGWQDRLLGGERHGLGRGFAGRFGRVVIFDREHKHIRSWIEGWRGAAELLELPLSAQAKGLHLVEANIAAAVAGGITVADPAPRLTTPEPARARLAPLGTRVVGIQAGSSLTSRWFRRQPNLKGLSPAQWAALLVRIIEGGDADAAVLLGSPPEGREARAIIMALPPALRPRVHDWTRGVGIAELPAVLAALRACISVDTGPAHICAAIGTPLLTVFGPTDPGRFAPRGPGAIGLVVGSAPCRPCHGTPLFRTCRANVCLGGLADEAIHAAWRKLISA